MDILEDSDVLKELASPWLPSVMVLTMMLQVAPWLLLLLISFDLVLSCLIVIVIWSVVS